MKNQHTHPINMISVKRVICLLSLFYVKSTAFEHTDRDLLLSDSVQIREDTSFPIDSIEWEQGITPDSILDTISVRTDSIRKSKVTQNVTLNNDSINEHLTLSDTMSLPIESYLTNNCIINIPDSVQYITMENARDLLIKNNNEIRSVWFQWKSKYNEYKGSFGIYEPKVSGKYESQIQGKFDSDNSEISNIYEGGIRGNTPIGTEYEFKYEHRGYNRSKDKTSSIFLGFNVKQPLLEGLILNSPASEIKLSKIENEIAFNQFRGLLLQKLYDLESLYWKLAYFQQLLLFENESVEMAINLYRDAKIRIVEGKISQLNLEKTEAELAVRITKQIDIEQQLRLYQNELWVLISNSLVTDKKPFKVVSDLSVIENVSDIIISDADKICKIQPEILVRKNELEKQKTVLKSYKGKLLPAVNFTGTYGIISEAKSEIAVINKFRSSDFRDKLLAGGVEVEIPLIANLKQRYSVKAQENLTLASEKELKTTEKKLLEQNELFRDKLIKLYIQIKGNNQEVLFRKKELDSELDKLKVGKSSYKSIYEIEEKYREARENTLQSIVNYKIAKAELAKIDGSMLSKLELECYENGRIVLNPDLKSIMNGM